MIDFIAVHDLVCKALQSNHFTNTLEPHNHLRKVNTFKHELWKNYEFFYILRNINNNFIVVRGGNKWIKQLAEFL